MVYSSQLETTIGVCETYPNLSYILIVVWFLCLYFTTNVHAYLSHR